MEKKKCKGSAVYFDCCVSASYNARSSLCCHEPNARDGLQIDEETDHDVQHDEGEPDVPNGRVRLGVRGRDVEREGHGPEQDAERSDGEGVRRDEGDLRLAKRPHSVHEREGVV